VRGAVVGSKQPVRDVGEPLMLTYKEACKKLGVSMSWLYTLMRNGEIRALELGPQVRRIPMTELEAYLARKMSEQFGTKPGTAA
jgi:excisionase family DNA binding protein